MVRQRGNQTPVHSVLDVVRRLSTSLTCRDGVTLLDLCESASDHCLPHQALPDESSLTDKISLSCRVLNERRSGIHQIVCHSDSCLPAQLHFSVFCCASFRLLSPPKQRTWLGADMDIQRLGRLDFSRLANSRISMDMPPMTLGCLVRKSRVTSSIIIFARGASTKFACCVLS